VVEDEQGKKEEAITVFKKLLFQDKVLMVFGPTLSNSAQAADPVANAAKTVVFGTSNTADGITSIGDVHVPQLGDRSRRAAGHAARGDQACRHQEGRGHLRQRRRVHQERLRQLQEAALEDQKIAVTGTETFAKGDVDFKAQLTKLKAGNPDAIVLSALLAEEARQHHGADARSSA
jgi:branched-chain amino acid transport system substrate-binding protein